MGEIPASIFNPNYLIVPTRRDALLAAKGVGAVQDFEVINDWLTFDPPVSPDAERVKIYNEYYREWKGLYEALKEPFTRLQNLP